jgi:methyl-accepting chemotaxis protein
MRERMKKVTGAGVLATAAALAVITALGTTATLGVAGNVNRKISVVEKQITRSCELNEGMKASLDPTVDLNDKAGVVSGYIAEILKTMSGMRDGLAAMVETIQKTNGVLSGVGGHTEKLTQALNSLIPCIEQLADAIQKGNVASESSVGLLDQINELNASIAGEMSQMRGKLASSATYKIVFTYAMPVLP